MVIEWPTYSMIGVVAHNLAKCGEVVSQIEFGIGLLRKQEVLKRQ